MYQLPSSFFLPPFLLVFIQHSVLIHIHMHTFEVADVFELKKGL